MNGNIIFGIPVVSIDYASLARKIEEAIETKEQITITYANQNTLNIVYSDSGLQKIFTGFSIVHPDGIGVYLAAKFLYAKKALANRFTGSDFYLFGIERFAGNHSRLFFFGNREENLNRIPAYLPLLEIVGTQNGFDFDDSAVVKKINSANPDILFVGLGTPKQEAWVSKHKNSLTVPVIICVGDGIKIFCGRKERGPLWAQKAGFEWLFRMYHEPKRLWKRYVIGIPVFFTRVFKNKVLMRKDV